MLDVGAQRRPVSSWRSSTPAFVVGQAAVRRGAAATSDAGRAQVGERHPAGVADAGVPAGQRDVAEVGEPRA